MIAIIADNLKKKIQFLGYYQIIGGVLGVALTLWLLVNYNLRVTSLFLILIIFGSYIFSMYCGKILLDSNIYRGLSLSTLNQALQTLNFAIGGIAFKFIAGLDFSIGIDLTKDFKFIYEFALSQFNININSHKEILTVEVNLVALCLLVFIRILYKEYQSTKDIANKERTSEVSDSELMHNT